MTADDRFRADAALVYRSLRDAGPASSVDLAERCFPLSFGRSDPLYGRLMKGSLRRVYDSIVWMRHQGVVLSAVPTSSWPGSTIFSLGSVSFDPTKVARFVSKGSLTDGEPEPGVSRDTHLSRRDPATEIDVWHGTD